MKIASVDAFAIAIGEVAKSEYHVSDSFRGAIYPGRHQTVIARIETDDGTVGYGEGQAPVAPQATKAIVKTLLRPMLFGQDPFASSMLWYRMYSALRERGHQTGFYPDALAAVDIALWDIKGKVLGQPVYNLLGGPFRDRIEVYAGLTPSSPEDAVTQAKEHVAAGYRAIKLHVRRSASETAAITQNVRDAVGPEIKIMVDVHTEHTVSSAISLGRQLASLDVTWLESPLVPEDIGGLVEVSRTLDVPVASSEWTRTRWDVREALERRAFDIMMPDVARTGLTEGMAIAALAETHNIPLAPHIGGGGVVSTVASLHFSAAIPNFVIMEHNHDEYFTRARITRNHPKVVDGEFRLPEGAGLGIPVDDGTLEEFMLSDG